MLTVALAIGIQDFVEPLLKFDYNNKKLKEGDALTASFDRINRMRRDKSMSLQILASHSSEQ